MKKLQSFIRASTAVRLSRIVPVLVLVLISGIFTPVIMEELGQSPTAHAQQQMVMVSTANAGAALQHTYTASLTTTATSPSFASGSSMTLNYMTGNHNIYGIDAQNTGTQVCWIQFYDYSAGSVTPGTTIARYAYPVLPMATTGTIGMIFTTFVSPLPLLNISSTLSMAATLTPTGSTSNPCSTVYASVAFK